MFFESSRKNVRKYLSLLQNVQNPYFYRSFLDQDNDNFFTTYDFESRHLQQHRPYSVARGDEGGRCGAGKGGNVVCILKLVTGYN